MTSVQLLWAASAAAVYVASCWIPFLVARQLRAARYAWSERAGLGLRRCGTCRGAGVVAAEQTNAPVTWRDRAGYLRARAWSWLVALWLWGLLASWIAMSARDSGLLGLVCR